MKLSDALHIVIELAEQNMPAEWDSSDFALTKQVRRQEQAIAIVEKLLKIIGE